MTIINVNNNTPVIDGLSISKSNVLINQVPVITDAGTGEVAAYISDPDHSLNYTCGTGATNFSVSYGTQSNITYVGISGHTAATPTQATIELYDGVTLVDSVVLQRNNNVMFTFALRNFSDLIVKFVTVPNNYQMTVSFIAAGQHIILATGEQAGYSRNWLNRHLTQRTTSSLQVGPIATTQKKKSLKGVLSLPNQLSSFAEVTWQSFLDFSYDQPFFIKEVSSKPESTYICFNPMSEIKAHAQTRVLDVVQLKFDVYNGL